jgi:hypothetical protein
VVDASRVRTYVTQAAQKAKETLPHALFSIKQFAFHNSSSLSKVVFNYLINEIGDLAFLNCVNLSDAFGGNSIRLVREDAFLNTLKHEFVFGSSNINVPTSTIAATPLWERFTVHGSNNYYSVSGDGTAIISMDQTVLLASVYSKAKVSILPGSTTIASFAFHSSQIATAEGGSNVTAIIAHAFDNCNLLTSVILLDSLAKIEAFAFANCSALK